MTIRIKMKLLDFTLMGLLVGMSPLALAQDATRDDAGDGAVAQGGAATTPAGTGAQCDAESCRDADGLLFRLRTRSYDQPATRGTSAASSAQALQPDRRVTIAAGQALAPGKAHASGKFGITLPDGGAIWAIEDPNLGEAVLSVSAPSMVPFDGQRIIRSVTFYMRTNYSAFVKRYELSIFRAGDTDLITPVATLPLPVEAVGGTEWPGTLPTDWPFRAGDTLVYVVRAYDADGNFDETRPQTLQLVTPEEAARGNRILRDNAEKAFGATMTADQAEQRSLVDAVFASNGLRLQNISLYGSRVRIVGRDLPQGYTLKINGEAYPVDLERKFAAEYLLPVGVHRFDIALDPQGTDGSATPRQALRDTFTVDVSGRYMFGVGLADVTIAQNDISGSTASFQGDTRYQDDVISDGRLAFYGKARFAGKYLVTAQADTTERDLQSLFNGFGNAYPQDVFRRLDPYLYYPVYGDDSTAWRDVDTMGRFYLRVDWDKNQALWGNYATGITGTEYGQYVRSLYGAAVNWRSRRTNAWGDPGTELRAFGSQAQSAPGHDAFIGTGGSLYYLHHTDLLPGSDVVTLEVRDLTTGLAEARVVLVRGADYEIDELQGRILLSRPLAQITREHMPTLTRDTPLDGYQQRLLVDYEWIPTGFDPDEVTAGLRAKHWFGDHFSLGATYVDENQAGQDYTMTGGDFTLQAGKGTYLKGEYTRTRAYSAPVFVSDNGGFTFTPLLPAGTEGDAKALEARVNLKEMGWTAQDWSAGGWWREVSAGYAAGSRFDTGLAVTEYGAEVRGYVTPDMSVYARANRTERGTDRLTQVQMSGEWRVSDVSSVSAELRRIEEDRAGNVVAGTLGAFKYSRRFGGVLDLYGIAQLTLDDDGGQYRDNNALTIGGKYLFGNLSSVGGELTAGDRGNAATLNAEYRLSPEHSIYGSYTWSTDRTGYDPLFNPNPQTGWTLGQRWRLSSRVNLYNESQYLKAPNESGLAHTFGLDFYPALGWNLGLSVQRGDLESLSAPLGMIHRTAISLSAGRSSPATDWQSKLEWRRDTGIERREQWVSTNRLVHRVNDSLRLAARFNYADTRDSLDPAAGAKFIEGNAGFAWRPWNSLRWGVFGRYTYLYDLATLGQVGGAQYDQKTQVFSLEGVYKYSPQWEFGGKLARRWGEVRFGRGTGAWFDSDATFVAGQVRYELRAQWHALAEYRWLGVAHGGDRQGVLLGVDRDITRSVRVGLGYNFTDFSDDLTNFDYRQRGFYLNLVGKY